MRAVGIPVASVESPNCTWTESLERELFSARIRIQRWYGTPATAVNGISK